LVSQNSSHENNHSWFQWVPLNKISFIEIRLEKFLRIGLILHFRPSSSKWVFKASIVFFLYVFRWKMVRIGFLGSKNLNLDFPTTIMVVGN
jgi:hypothetical protein